MKTRREKIMGILGTVLFHGIILLILLAFTLNTKIPEPGSEGLVVNLGYTEEGTGKTQPEEPSVVEKSTPPSPAPSGSEEIVTQETQEAPSMEDAPVDKEKEEEKPVEEDKVKPEEEQEQEKPEINERALYKGKSKDASKGENEGVTGETGDQGKQLGDEDAANREGKGGEGEGISFSLKGRGAKYLPKPEYKSEEQGQIVVNIWVDRDGNVTKAIVSARGTNISDLNLRRQAEKAAKNAVFSADRSAPEVQKGTITYKFIRLN
ncbi:MAG: TonB family protein [Bacteroidales bacterium]|nr:TonB family protein [Bacteroidales bacterium]